MEMFIGFSSLIAASFGIVFITMWWTKRSIRIEKAPMQILWEARIADTTRCLDLDKASARYSLIDYHILDLKMLDRDPAYHEPLFKFSNVVRSWNATNLSGRVEVIPIGYTYPNDNDMNHYIWFENPNDALAFKMRWF